MKQFKKIFLIVSSLILAFSTNNLAAVKTRSAKNESSFQEFTPTKVKKKVSKTTKSPKKEKPTILELINDCPMYKLKKILGRKVCSYISRTELDENKIYMTITNINHNIDVISEKPALIGNEEMDKIRLQFNNCTPESKESILRYIKTKNYYLTSFYSAEENILLVNLNLPYHERNIQRIKNVFNRDASKIFAGQKLQADVLENVGRVIYDPDRKKFVVSFCNTHSDLLFKISKYFHDKDYQVWCRKESNSMSIGIDPQVTYDKIKNELNDYINDNPLYAPHADEILKF